jgi:hypothetical protein
LQCFSNEKGQDDYELPPLDNRLVASAAARLDAAKIPYVLWGNYMLTIFGIPTVVKLPLFAMFLK